MNSFIGDILHNIGKKDDSVSRGFQYGVDTFYDNNKPEKEIIEPQRFVAPRFLHHSERPAFSVARELIKHTSKRDIIEKLEASGLSGCGGANFPVAVKWKAALDKPGRRYLIVNGQEGEPFTFKDYMLMKNYPRTVVEGVFIAARALKVDEVIFTINSAYKKCLENMEVAMGEGLSVIPEMSGVTFRIVSGPKPDLYVCGEETALIEYLENRRGEPQLKPPFPFESGYRGQPTVIQNVETLAWIPLLMANPRLFADQGHIKLVNLFGAVQNPGIYEVRIGSSLRHLLETAGGLSVGSSVQAIEVGGAGGGLLPPDCLALALEQEVMSEWGAMVGTGSVRFLDRNINLVEEVLHAMEFFRNESCGRCTPCRVGTQELVRIAEGMNNGSANDEELEWFDDLARTMTDTATCGLGKGAPTMLLSLLRYWDIADGRAQLKVSNVIDARQQVSREVQMA